MAKRYFFPLVAIASMGLAFSFNGCSCSAKMGTPPQTAAATPPPPPPPAPPPAPAPAPAPAPVKPRIVAVGKATIVGNKVSIPGELEFDVDKATIKHSAQSDEILNTLVDFMKQNANVTKLRVEGHTDNTGTAAHNEKLSQERADAVATWLVAHGVDKSRIFTKGFGQAKPLVANDSDDHKHMNRRTEFHVQDLDGKAADDASATSTTSASATTK